MSDTVVVSRNSSCGTQVSERWRLTTEIDPDVQKSDTVEHLHAAADCPRSSRNGRREPDVCLTLNRTN